MSDWYWYWVYFLSPSNQGYRNSSCLKVRVFCASPDRYARHSRIFTKANAVDIGHEHLVSHQVFWCIGCVNVCEMHTHVSMCFIALTKLALSMSTYCHDILTVTLPHPPHTFAKKNALSAQCLIIKRTIQSICRGWFHICDVNNTTFCFNPPG